jgi:WD40 repeat protein
LLVVGSSYGIHFYNAENGQTINRIDIPESGVKFVALSPNGTQVAAWNGSTIRIYRVNDRALLYTFKIRGGINDEDLVKFSSDGKMLAAPSEDRHSVNLYSTTDGSLIFSLNPELNGYEISSMSFSPNGTWLVANFFSFPKEDVALIYNIRDKTLLDSLSSNACVNKSLVFSPDSSYLAMATGDSDGKCLYKVGDKYHNYTLLGNRVISGNARFTPNWTFVISKSSDTIHIRKVEKKGGIFQIAFKPSHTLLEMPTYEYTISPDGTKLALISALVAKPGLLVWRLGESEPGVLSDTPLYTIKLD